jgi:hypothetical protein
VTDDNIWHVTGKELGKAPYRDHKEISKSISRVDITTEASLKANSPSFISYRIISIVIICIFAEMGTSVSWF